MGKKSFLCLTMLILLLSGCTDDADTTSKQNEEKTNEGRVHEYSGSSLKIAVVGDIEKLAKFKEVSYQDRTLEYLSTNKEEDFDALIITSSAFEDADKEKYVQYFKKVKYPVFFLGTENISLAAFINENTTLQQANVNKSAYAQGYVNIDKDNEEQKYKMWNFNLPDNPKESDKNEAMLKRFFDVIEKYLK